VCVRVFVRVWGYSTSFQACPFFFLIWVREVVGSFSESAVFGPLGRSRLVPRAVADIGPGGTGEDGPPRSRLAARLGLGEGARLVRARVRGSPRWPTHVGPTVRPPFIDEWGGTPH